MPPEVSVIIPTHNRGPLLEKSLISLGSQDLDPQAFEVVVVDYGDKEDALKAVSSACGQAPSLSVRRVVLEGNGHPSPVMRPSMAAGNGGTDHSLPGRGPYKGLTRARNRGIREARGWLLVFLPPECLLTPSALRLCLDVHKRSETELVTTVRPYTVSEKATQTLDTVDWRRDAGLIRQSFGPEDVDRSETQSTWGDMHFGAVKKKWAAWICGHNERFQTWGYESIDFTERLCIYAVDYLEIVDERVGCYHLWHPPSEGHGDRRLAAIERMLNSYTRDVLMRTVRAMELLPRGRGAGPSYDQMYEFLTNLPIQTLNTLMVRLEKDYESTVLARQAREKWTHLPGSEILGGALWPGIRQAVQWGEYERGLEWLDLLIEMCPEDPAPLIEKSKLQRLQTDPQAVPAPSPIPSQAPQPA